MTPSRSSKTFRMMVLLMSVSLGSLQVVAWAGLTRADYESVQNPKEKQIEAIRLEEIRTVKTALSLRSAENRQAELYLRLSELYLESYRADFLLEGRLQEKNLPRNPNARLERSRSLDDLRNGIGAAEQILSLRVDRAKLDQVYYFLGYNYGELGDAKKSDQYYKRLAKEFPSSKYSSEGTRALADEAFQNGHYLDAQKQYEIAVKNAKEPAQQARIYHKLAWCYYRQRRTNDAVETMKKAIEIAKSSGGEKLLSIREEGLRDLAIYYAESGRVDEAIAYFKENSGSNEKLVRVLEKLGKEYERTGQVESAKKVYAVLLQLGEPGESSFRVEAKLIELDLLKEQFSSAYKRLVEIELPKSRESDTAVAVAMLRKEVRTTGVNNQERYRRISDQEGAKKYLQVAEQFYTLYLSKYLPDSNANKAERNEIRMYLAEVKRDLNAPGQAADLYKEIITDKDPKYSKAAAQLWVGSIASELKKRSANGEKPGVSPSPLENDFVEAADLLEGAIPNSVEAREASLRAAQILAAYGDKKTEAINRASKIAKGSPNTPQGVLAARLWLQLDPSSSTLNAIAQSQALLSQDKKQKGELARDIEASSKKIRVGEISELEKNKDFSRAALGYEAFIKTAKTPSEIEGAYLGAMNAYGEAGKSDQVLRIMHEWKTKFPKSKMIEKAVKTQATQFFIRGMFVDSAELFLAIGRLEKDLSSELTSGALFDGGLQKNKASEVYAEALKLATNDEERAKIYKLLAYVSIDQKNDEAAEISWKKCYGLNSALKAECGSQVGNYALRQEQSKKAKAVFTEIVQIKKGPSSKSPYIGYAQFRLAQILEKEMKTEPLVFPEAKLLKAFTSRVNGLKPVSNAYQEALELGGPWGIAATERLGDLSLSFSEEVEKVLKDPAASDQLKQALDPVSQALKKQALERSRSAYHLAIRNQILSPALPVIQDRLVDDQSSEMGRAQGQRQGIKLTGMSPDGGRTGSITAMAGVRTKLSANQDDALSWIDYGNLLWGSGKPGLAKVAYEKSFALKKNASDALNNLAVVMVSDLGFENWFAANEAVALWKKALNQESDHSAALYNLGHFFNYYRLFEVARPYFEKVSQKISIADVHDGLAVSAEGLGHKDEADQEFAKAEEAGAKANRFAKVYVMAARAVGAPCLTELSSIQKENELKGFEKISENRLKQRCQP